jgi:flagellar biosynthesis protein FlhG
MRDQASELRDLVLRSAHKGASPAAPRPWLVVMAGGKGGVGATTLAVNLSIALSRQGLRVVLVDADLYRADVAALCGLPERCSVNDVLSARRNIHEVLERGPAGIQVAPGLWAPGSVAGVTETAQRRLLSQLHALGRHADVVLLDVGGGSGEAARRFWKAADDVLLATTPDAVAVMDSYATVKALRDETDRASIHLIVNQADSDEIAADVHQRVDRSCRRFLGVSVAWLGRVPPDPQAVAAAQTASPLLIAAPESPAARAIERLGVALGARAPSMSRRRPA